MFFGGIVYSLEANAMLLPIGLLKEYIASKGKHFVARKDSPHPLFGKNENAWIAVGFLKSGMELSGQSCKT